MAISLYYKWFFQKKELNSCCYMTYVITVSFDRVRTNTIETNKRH